MLDGMLDNITTYYWPTVTNTLTQVVTPDATSVVD